MLRRFLRRVFFGCHDFGVWRTIHRVPFDGQIYTFDVRYCRKCGKGEFRRTVEEAEEPTRTITQMLREVHMKDEIGQEETTIL